jgi:hypothetical protein
MAFFDKIGTSAHRGGIHMFTTHEIPAMNVALGPTGCCPEVDPAAWNGKVFDFDSLRFVQVSTRSIFHIPLNMGKVYTETMKKIEAADAGFKDRYLTLSKDVSAQKSIHYFMVRHEVPGLTVVALPGRYLAKVYEGPYKNIPSWIQDMQTFADNEGLETEDFYSFYTTCPKCAKTYGKNYVILFAKIR